MIVIMAQMGSAVPAKFASVRVVDKLFTRIGTSDSIETNSSSFMVEMQETAHIVNHATERYVSTCATNRALLASWTSQLCNRSNTLQMCQELLTAANNPAECAHDLAEHHSRTICCSQRGSESCASCVQIVLCCILTCPWGRSILQLDVLSC